MDYGLSSVICAFIATMTTSILGGVLRQDIKLNEMNDDAHQTAKLCTKSKHSTFHVPSGRMDQHCNV